MWEHCATWLEIQLAKAAKGDFASFMTQELPSRGNLQLVRSAPRLIGRNSRAAELQMS